jgi:hypothetical protein
MDDLKKWTLQLFRHGLDSFLECSPACVHVGKQSGHPHHELFLARQEPHLSETFDKEIIV